MSLTKAEKALIQSLRDQASLTLPPYEEPQPISEDELGTKRPAGQKYVTGWFMNPYTRRVTLGWSDGYRHNNEAESPVDDAQYRALTCSQGAGRMYRSQRDAWRALRWVATRHAMEELGGLDAMIAWVSEEKPS